MCQSLSLYQKQDQIWSLSQVFDDDMNNSSPTWAAYNSLINKPTQKTICQGLPLYSAPPTDWSSLYTALKIVQGINVTVTASNKTVVNVDL